MKYLIILIFFLSSSFALTLTLNHAKEENTTLSILHIESKQPFICEKRVLKDFKKVIECRFPAPLMDSYSRQNMELRIDTVEGRLRITPKRRFRLYPVEDDLVAKEEVSWPKKTGIKHWVVIASQKPISLFERNRNPGLKFPIPFVQKELPYVGALDIDTLPLRDTKIAVEVKKLKKLYEKRMYQNVVNTAKMLLEDGRGSFSADILLYKIRAQERLNSTEKGAMTAEAAQQLIDDAKAWIEKFPSNEHLPEVLMLMTKTYFSLGHMKEGNRYLQILEKEFPDSKYTEEAMIYLADRLVKTKKREEAIKKYEAVYYRTKNIEVASLVAQRLARLYLESGYVKKAASYIGKIIKANPDYIQKRGREFYKIASRFAKEKQYKIALELANLIFEKETDRIFREPLLKDKARWEEKAGLFEEAKEDYEKYLHDYKRGKYREFVKERLERLLLDLEESNTTKRVEMLERILKKYKNDPIYAKALRQKAEILLQQQRYDTLLQMADELKKYKSEEILQKAAEAAMKRALKNGICKKATELYEKYRLKPSYEEEKELFACYRRMLQYQKALKLAEKYTHSENLKERAYWLYQEAKIAFETGAYKKAVQIAEDLEKIAKLEKLQEYDDILYLKAKSHYYLDENGKFLTEVEKIEKRFPDRLENLELYDKVIRYAKKHGEDLLLIKYAEKIIMMQKKHHISTYTPKVELDYIEVLKRMGRYAKALQVDIGLLYERLTDAQRAQVLFEAGDLSLKLGKEREAKAFFRKCGEVVEDNSWVKLCAQSLKMLEE
ncbi:MAG: hypothetical protein B6D59_06905 [Campylobacteraceae bacterium 4484_4]|nr:MAG: hypothetical protein B6D59_06905 [Campylobacteraceae bacterium 4484_4]